MEKVYVIQIEEVVDYVDYGHPLEAFRNREDAEKRYKEIVESAKSEEEFGGPDYEDWAVEEREWSYEVYEDGYYAHNHYSVAIYEVEVK